MVSALTMKAGMGLPSRWLTTATAAAIGSAPTVIPPTASAPASAIMRSIRRPIRYAPSGQSVTLLPSK